VSELDLDWLISVDDHIIEPAHVWQRWVPAKYKERAPKLVRGVVSETAWVPGTSDEEGHVWSYDGKLIPIVRLSAVAGTPREDWNMKPIDYDRMNPAYSDQKARIEAMDIDGVLAALLFPTFPRFCGQTFLEAKDKELALVCVQAYNDWMVQEWCAEAPGRFIPLAIVPLWDPELAAAEVRRCAAMGVHSISFSENPSKLGLPSIHDADRHWDPLWQACDEHGITLSIHIGSSSVSVKTSPDTPLIESLSLNAMNGSITFVDWMYSGILLRFPNIKVAASEGGVGWMPWALARVARDLDRQQWTRTSSLEGNIITGDARDNHRSKFGTTPHFDVYEVYRNQFFGCMLADDWGLEVLPFIGTDNVMLETDYPHSDSSWPNSVELARESMKPLSDEVRYKLLQGTARRVYDFTPADTSTLRRGAPVAS
jgi:predicted TIM-barrel fold metal-dependent hydrolase